MGMNGRLIEPDVRQARDCCICVNQSDAGTRFQLRNQPFVCVGTVPIVSIGVSQVLATRLANRTVPRRVNRLPGLGSDIADIAIPLLKFLNDTALILFGTAVNDNDLESFRYGLRFKVLQATPYIVLAVIRRNDCCNQIFTCVEVVNFNDRRWCRHHRHGRDDKRSA